MSLISNLKDKVAQYVDVYVRLIKINFIGRTSNLLGYFMFAIISLFLVFCIVLFVGFGLSEVFQGMGVSKMVGFFLTVAFYFLLLIISCAIAQAYIAILCQWCCKSSDRRG